jgi:hypothetical protein
MVKYLVLQYYTTSKVMQLVGPDNIPKEIIDAEPDLIFPSHMPGEDETKPSQVDKIKRARTFADNLQFVIQPNSLHEYQQMEYRLGLIQLVKAGVKISSQTIAEAWNIQDYGKFDGLTEKDRYWNEKEEDLEYMVKGEVLKQKLEMADAASQLIQPPGSAQPGKQPEGRPTTGMDSPRLVSKDQGTRSTITQVR